MDNYKYYIVSLIFLKETKTLENEILFYIPL